MGRFRMMIRGAVSAVAPSITSASTVSVAENATLSHPLTADQTVTWAITGGADSAKFEISGSTLRWASNGTKDYESPDDAGTNNVYDAQVTATNATSGLSSTAQAIAITVTDVTEGGIPASVATPVVGTDLSAVYNLQFAGTGPRTSFTNGTWGARALAANGTPTGDTYLNSIGVGFVVNNNGSSIFLDIGSSTVTISNYDFSGLPVRVDIGGSTGTVNFVDCKFSGTVPASYLMFPTGINTTLSPYDGDSVTVNCSYCTFSSSQFFQGAGFLNFSHCKFTGQKNQLGGSTFHGTSTSAVTFDWCYIPGGGIQPDVDVNNHVELFQMIRSGQLVVTNTLVTLSEGQVTAPAWLSAWTGLWSGPDYQRFTNCIMIGGPAVNANASNPNTMKCCVSYGTGVDVVVTNCVMETGWAGYTVNATPGAAYASINGGGNRTYANAALVTADFG